MPLKKADPREARIVFADFVSQTNLSPRARFALILLWGLANGRQWTWEQVQKRIRPVGQETNKDAVRTVEEEIVLKAHLYVTHVICTGRNPLANKEEPSGRKSP